MICGIDWAKGEDPTCIVFVDNSSTPNIITKAVFLTREETETFQKKLRLNKGWEHA